MNTDKVKIKIFSDIEDITSINSALRQIELESIPIAFTNPKLFAPEEDTIFILQIVSIDSKILTEVLSQKRDINNKIIIVIKNNNALLVSSLVKMGFYDLFVFPYEILRFTSFIKEIVQNGLFKTSLQTGYDDLDKNYNLGSLIGNSESFKKVLTLSKKVSKQSDSNILLLGETGTGKGLFARAIHNFSKGKNGAFVDIVCTAIPENLLESELFGYEAGAFTNARTRKIGLFELASDGTLFLDEIGDLSLNLQAKLLRAIEKKVIKRLGGLTDIPINARIISATNKNIEQMIEEGSFRRDLYHRLNVVTIELPPLRNREEDVLLLADHFIDEFNREFGKNVKKISKELKHLFLSYPWTGNVRELRNALERAVLLSDDGNLNINDFQSLKNSVPVENNEFSKSNSVPDNIIRLDINYGTTDLRKLNKFYAEKVLEKVEGNKANALKLLNISRPNLNTLLSKKKK